MPITQIMRKTVIDGSNTSGFQRTVLIAKNGYLETENGRVGIESVFLEEDAARIVERTDKKEIYKLDRLGIPLVEIVTAPDIKNAVQAKEVALQIGSVLRSCKVRRGIGTIRQDVNISIRDENRVELKGMQDMNIFVDVVDGEVLRQKKLSDSKKPTKMEVRNAQKDGSTKFMRPLPGSARMYPETDLPLLRISKGFIDKAKKSLPKLKGDIEDELKKEGLSSDMIQLLFKQDKLEEFKKLIAIYNQPNFIANVVLIYPKDLASRKNKSIEEVDEVLDEKVLRYVLEALGRKKISEKQVKHVLDKIIDGEKPKQAIKFEKHDWNTVEEKIMNIIKGKPGLSDKAYMGLVMKEFRGKIEGQKVMEIIKKYIK